MPTWLTFGAAKWIAIGVAFLALLAYIGFLKLEVNHYRTDRDNIQAAFSAVVHNQAARQTALEGIVKAQDEARQRERAEAEARLKAASDQHLKDIQDNENLRKRIVSNELVSVLNRPIIDSGGPNKESTTDASKSTGNATAPGVDSGPVCTEQDIAYANEINKVNFERMRETIVELQKVITDNERNLNGTP